MDHAHRRFPARTLERAPEMWASVLNCSGVEHYHSVYVLMRQCRPLVEAEVGVLVAYEDGRVALDQCIGQGDPSQLMRRGWGMDRLC